MNVNMNAFRCHCASEVYRILGILVDGLRWGAFSVVLVVLR